MSDVDPRSPETAYATKPNIVYPGSAAQATAAAEAAARRDTDNFPAAADGKAKPTTMTRATAVVTKTHSIRR